ncbi:glycerol-3-phosphate responsive antiterminator [Alkalihalobacterium bogoriense]|uniref:glycerol-3-phosphate responsive antiterminator n=1 Tax=Alkalihalobacterium bogoriense TaxID=246272 RepID=UPI00047ADE6C|nr:glycerol-3-phosphate responsive antiterminator [Alkalihalobacterium bogoriense]
MFNKREVIASVHNEIALQRALELDEVKTIFLINGDILTLQENIKHIRKYDKRLFLHFDTIQGLSTDVKGVNYTVEILKPDGILSTRGQVIQHAKKLGLLTIQRLFLIDTTALNSGVRSIKQSNPDAVEAMPGLMPRVISELCSHIEQPVVAGGLIKENYEVELALDAGAVAVSLSDISYWKKKGV